MPLTDAIDLMTRGGVIALLLLISISVCVQEHTRQHISSLLAVGLGVTFSLYLIVTSSLSLHFPPSVHLGLRLLDAPNLIFVWLLLLSIYLDAFRLSLWHGLIAAGYFVLMVVERLMEAGILSSNFLPSAVFFIASLGLIGHVIWTLVSGLKNDLVENRRRSRFIILFIILLAATISVINTNLKAASSHAVLEPMSLLVSLFAVLIVGLNWLRFKPDSFYLAPTDGSSTATKATLTHKQKTQLDTLEALMTEDRLYLNPDMTIGLLARNMGLGEHVLRQLINQHMGARNFPAFLNSYRISDAKTRLSDPQEADTSILTIAMNTGFNSLSAFNRAFKNQTQLTPSQFRKKPL